MNLSRPLQFTILLIVLVIAVGCDQTTKHFARTKLNQFDSVAIMRGFGELRLAENSGAFLSLGASLPPTARKFIFTIAAGIGLLGLFVYLLVRPQSDWLNFIGLAMALAGGISNLIDRVTRGGLVTDFITLRCGPLHTGVFNVADMLVMLGIALFVWAAWKKQRAEQSAKNCSD